MVFFVVFSGSWCATVPESWLNKTEKTLAWPNKKLNATKACKNNCAPKSDWNTSKFDRLLGPYENYDIARTVEIAAVDLSTCDESSVQAIVDSKKNSKRQRRKPSRFRDDDSNSSSDTDKKSDGEHDEGVGLDNLKKHVLPSFEYDGGDDNIMESLDDEIVGTQELTYGTFSDDPPHPNFEKKGITSNTPTIRCIENIQIPGIGKRTDGSEDKDCQKIKDLSQSNSSNRSENANNGENKPAPSSAVGSNGTLIKPKLVLRDSAEAGFSGTTQDATNKPAPSSAVGSNGTLIKPKLVLRDSAEAGFSGTTQDATNKPAPSSAVGSNGTLIKPKLVVRDSAEAGFSGTTQDATNTRALSSRSTSPDQFNRTDTEQPSKCRHNCCLNSSILNSISRKVDALLNISSDNPRPSTTKQSNLLPDFPISTYEQLEKFNDLMTNKEVARTQYEDLIKQRRMSDGKKFIRGVLGHILTDELCCKLSWSGQKKTIKVEDMPFVKYLRNTVTAVNSRCSLDDCKQAIMSWLQHANDRVKKTDDKHIQPL